MDRRCCCCSSFHRLVVSVDGQAILGGHAWDDVSGTRSKTQLWTHPSVLQLKSQASLLDVARSQEILLGTSQVRANVQSLPVIRKNGEFTMGVDLHIW